MFKYIVIDDENLIRKGTVKKLSLLSDILQCVGEASNGKEGIELVEKSDPDIIITDMNMPVMDGMEFLPYLTKCYPNKQIIVISGYKDFEYTKQALLARAVNYILKPFSREEIQSSVRNAIQNIENNAAIQQEIVTSEEQREQACYEYDIQLLKNITLGFDSAPYNISSKKLKSVEQTHDFIMIMLSSTNPLEETQIQNILSENGFGDLALYLSHPNNGVSGFLILFIPKRTVIAPKDLCVQVVKGLCLQFEMQGKNLIFGISGLHSNLIKLHEAFKESVSALNSQFINTHNAYYFYNENPEIPKDIHWSRSEELLFRTEAGMTDEVVELLNEMFEYFNTIPMCTIADVKYYCFDLTEKVKAVLASYFDQVRLFAIPSSMQNILNGLFSLEEIREYYIQLFSNVSGMLKMNNVYVTDDVVEKMKTYMQRNYKKDITVEFISSLFYMSRSYCSHLFKQRAGVSFVDYLNSIRIQKAKQLLLESDKKMYQIARSVGYDNVKYFFRIFNKLEKMTPNEYRKRHRENTDEAGTR